MLAQRLLYQIGLLLLALLSLLYVGLLNGFPSAELMTDPFGIVMVFFIASIVYLISILTYHMRLHGFKRLHKGDEFHYSVALVLFSLSAHALNLTEIRVFQPYVGWMQVYVLLMHASILVFPWRAQLPAWAQYVVYFMQGAGLVMAIYLTIFLGPLIGIAIPAAILLGLSMHATVPLWWALRFGASYTQLPDVRQYPHAKRAYWMGAIIPILVISFYVNQWTGIHREIEARMMDYQIHANEDLPLWVHLSQHLSDDPITEYVLLSGSMTQRSFWHDGVDVLGFGARREFVKHDPLALIGLSLRGELNISTANLSRILEARYDVRHMTHRRLWRGHDLNTASIHTTVDLYPKHRLAYEEMVLTIENKPLEPWRRKWSRWSRQEAVYSFYLPEGATATSLSLWIEGKEEKSRLTTRSKADSAYETIVGREARDPALMHWQEGNRVTVTIFPCTTEEERKFKIGFTMPLMYRSGRLVLSNIPFEGPATEGAEHHTDVYVKGVDGVADVSLPVHWNEESEAHFQLRGSYQPDWELSFKAPTLGTEPFIFAGKSYQVQAPQRELQPWRPQAIILDINSAWTGWDARRIWKSVHGFETYVFAPHLTRVTSENHHELFTELLKKEYSLLPLYDIPQPDQTLIISASDGNTPLLEDLENTPYSQHMTTWSQQRTQALKWVNLTEELAPYAMTLYDLRLLDLQQVSMEVANTWLDRGQFPVVGESDSVAYIPVADMMITETATLSQGRAGNDHVKRLYAFQQLMRALGPSYYERNAYEEAWIKEAEEAYIVTPISSLVVLESQKDYDRFGIEENTDTLGNAIAKGDGAAPEPHEWVILLIAAIVLAAVAKRQGMWGL